MSVPCAGKRSLDNPSFPLPKRLKVELIPSIPQFIAEMNACLNSNLGAPLKIQRLGYKIDVFPPFSLDMQNPFYGAQLYEIAEKCLSYDPANKKFKQLKKTAEKMRLPHDLIIEIFKLFAQGQGLKAMFSRIDDPLSEIKFPTMVDGALVQIKFTSLLHRIGSVSEIWRKTLFSVFCKNISIANLTQLKICKQEDVIKLATLCRGHFSSLALIDNNFKKLFLDEENWKKLLDLLPHLKKLDLSAFDTNLNEILHSPLMSKLEDLRLVGEGYENEDDGQALTFLKTVHLTNLKALSICNLQADNSFLPLPPLPNLKSLNLSGTYLPPNPFTLVKKEIRFPLLEELLLDDCNSDFSFLTHFVAPRLYKLDISGYSLNIDGINLFAGFSCTSCVKNLSVSLAGMIKPSLITHLLNNFTHLQVLKIITDASLGVLDEEGAQAIAEHPNAVQLQALKMEYSTIGNKGLGFLLESSYLTNLQKLFVPNNFISLEGLQSFATTQMTLKSLVLDDNEFDEEGFAMKILTTAASTAKMEILSLNGCELSLPSQKILAKTTHFTILRTLLLSGTEFTEDYVKVLARNSHFANLETIDLSHNDIDDDVWPKFAKSTRLKGLRNLLLNTADQTSDRVKNILFNKHLNSIYPA